MPATTSTRLVVALTITGVLVAPHAASAQAVYVPRAPIAPPMWQPPNPYAYGMPPTGSWSAAVPNDWVTGADLEQLFRGNTVVSRLVGRPAQAFFFASDGSVLSPGAGGSLVRAGSWVNDTTGICTVMQNGRTCWRFRIVGRQVQAWQLVDGYRISQVGTVDLYRGNQLAQSNGTSGGAALAGLAILGLGALLLLNGSGAGGAGRGGTDVDLTEEDRRRAEEERRLEQERRRNEPRTNPSDGVGCAWGFQSTGTCVK